VLLGLVVLLLLRVREADVVEAVLTFRVERKGLVERLNGVVVLAGPAQCDALVEGLAKLGGLRGQSRVVGVAAAGADDESNRRRSALADARVGDGRAVFRHRSHLERRRL